MKVFTLLLLAAIATAQAEKEDWLWFDFEARIDFLWFNWFSIVYKDGNELQVGDTLDGKFAVNLNAVCDDTGFSCTETYARYATAGKLLIPSIRDIPTELTTELNVRGLDETYVYSKAGFEISASLYDEQNRYFQEGINMGSRSPPLADLNALDLSFFKSLELNWFDDHKNVFILYSNPYLNMIGPSVSATIVSVSPSEPEGHCVQNCAKIHQACMEECNMLSQAKKTCEEECKDDFEDCKSNCPRPNN